MGCLTKRKLESVRATTLMGKVLRVRRRNVVHVAFAYIDLDL